MSAQDIRLSVHFPDHPKTVKLERRLGFQGVRSLLSLWAWAAQNRPDGDLGGATDMMAFLAICHPEAGSRHGPAP